jgi:phosphatidylglycerophosphate synthase
MKRKYYIGKNSIADLLSIYRIVTVPLLFTFVFTSSRTLFSWFLLVSFITDILDGYLARKLKIQSERGARLDSIGDFLTLVTSVTALVYFEWDTIVAYRAFFILTIAPYLLQMLLAWMKFGKTTSFHTYIGKFAFLVQGIYLLWVFFFGNSVPLLYLATITALLTSIEEIILVFYLKKERTNVKGLFWVLKERNNLPLLNKKIPSRF